MTANYDLHRLGWKAFQDLCVALAEERLQRPVQTFLPTNDAGEARSINVSVRRVGIRFFR